MKNPSREICEWYRAEARALPWRETRDPYLIWISEVILQQTRVAQGLDYYHRFTERFPDVQSLAEAPLDEVLKYWEGLGYYSRARNLHHSAKEVAGPREGVFPTDHKGWLELKGIGPYTARAISSLAYGERVGVLDGNVMRVLSRYLADDSPIDLPATRREFQAILDSWIRHADPVEFNQGMMELGALICTPRNPDCVKCPVQEHCRARKEGRQVDFPVKAKKLKRDSRDFDFFLVRNAANELLIRRRPDSGLWSGLWEVPNQQSEGARPEARRLGGLKHVFTHFDMHITIWATDRNPLPPADTDRWVHPKKLGNFAFPRAVLKIFDAFLTAAS